MPAGLPTCAQYINFAMVAKKNGGFDKVPVNDHGEIIDAQDRRYWRTAAQAWASPANTHGIGFMVTPPYIGLDLDKCLGEDGNWSALSNEIAAALPGAYSDITPSGRGLRFIFRGELPEGHKCRFKGGEAYSGRRFLTITGNDAQGNGEWDGTAVCGWLETRLVLTPESVEELDWDGRDEAWRGPEDDAALIKLMLTEKRRSGQAMFGANVADLWKMDEAKLAADRKFAVKDRSDGLPFDHSAVDMAVMSHLSFYTGRDIPRMEALFQQWPGYRAWKYEGRTGYHINRVLSRAAQNPNVLQQKRKSAPAPAPRPADDGLEGYYAGAGMPKAEPELIQTLVPVAGAGDLVVLLGQSGAGKTFLVTALAVAHASGKPCMGFKVREEVGVVILAAEGAGTIAPRLWAAQKAAKIDGVLPIRVINGWPGLNDDNPASRVAFIAEINRIAADMRERFGVRLGVIIIDTATAALPMRDENDAMCVRDMETKVREIGKETGATIELVHHMGKNAETGARGTSAWRDIGDHMLALYVKRDASGKVEKRYLSVYKSRNGEEGHACDVKLNTVDMGVNLYNEPRSTGYMQRTDTQATDQKPRDIFHEIYDDLVKTRPQKMGEIVGVSADDFRNEFNGRSTLNPAATRQAWKRGSEKFMSVGGGYECRDGIIRMRIVPKRDK
jgi:KaiC/GvpD/RAD55 family RecA-like ATPase